MKSLLFSSVICGFALSSLAFSNDGFEGNRAKFCASPTKYICEGAAANELKAIDRNRKFVREALSLTLDDNKNAPPALLDQLKASIENREPLVRISDDDVPRVYKFLTDYLRRLRAQSPVGQRNFLQLYEAARRTHEKAIDNEPSLSPETRAKLKKRLTEPKIFVFEDILNFWTDQGLNTAVDLKSTLSAVTQVFRHCGMDLTADVSFFRGGMLSKKTKEGRLVDEPYEFHYFCPGAVFGVTDANSLISSQLAAAFSGDFIADIYDSFDACFLAQSGENTDTVFGLAAGGDQRKSIWQRFRGSVHADHWARASLHLQIEGRGLKNSQLGLDFVRESLSRYCDTKVGPSYATGDFRINEFYFRFDPLLADFGCARLDNHRTGCDLSGRVPAR
jgi:hypothetical protein